MKKQILSLCLLLALLLSLAGCANLDFLTGGTPAEKSDYPEAADDDHTVIRELQDGDTTYYCWEDGIVTTKPTYKADSVLYWENDTNEGAYRVMNSMGTVFISYYVQPTQPTEESTVPPTEDPYQGHSLEGIVTDPSMAVTYYCWDDGTATTEEAYNPSTPLTWTHPWNQNFFNIYSGHSDNGNVVYSEKACTWCNSHKVFYLSYVRDPYDFTQITEYLCESCHVDLVNDYYKCDACGYYCVKYYAITDGEHHYCEYCWLGGQN